MRAVLNLSAASQAYGVRSEVLSVGEIRVSDNPLDQSLVHCIPLRIPNRYGYTPELDRWLRQNIGRFDCVILHGMWLFPTRAAAKVCWESGVPYCVFPHGMLEPWSVREQGTWKYAKKFAYWIVFERIIFERARCTLFATTREMGQARKVFHFRWPGKVVAPYGVTDDSNPRALAAGGAIPELEDRNFLLFLGRIHPCKNIPFLIRAWAKAKVSQDWKIVIAGPSTEDYRRKVEKLSEELGVREQCVFLDFVAGATKEWLLWNAHWFALPSEHENFGVAMLEALAHGCPVVVSDQVYSTEFLEPLGRILPLEEQQWVDFFQTRLRDEAYRRQVTASDAKTIDGYRMAKVAEEWSETLETLFKKDSDRESVPQPA